MRKTPSFRRSSGRSRKGQRAIVEHILLLAATFSMLVMMSVLFGAIGSRVADSQLDNALTSLAEQTSMAVAQAYEAGRQTQAGSQPPVRIIMDNFPQTISGRQYAINYQPSAKSIVAISKDRTVKVRIPLSVSIEGTLYSSFAQRPAVSYFSEARYCSVAPPCIRLEMV